MKHFIDTKPRKITTNVIRLLSCTLGLSIQKGPIQIGQRSETKSSNLCCVKWSITQCLALLTEGFHRTSCPVANPASSNQPERETNSDP